MGDYAEERGRQVGWAWGERYGALCGLTVLLAGCLRAAEPLSPEEALAAAAQRINQILAEEGATVTVGPAIDVSGEPQDPATVSLWYFAHPLLAPELAKHQVLEEFRANYPQVTLKTQFLGDWYYAVQKLTVALAADDLPDLAVVTRGWLAPAVYGGKIAPLDMIVPKAFLDDFRPPVRRSFTVFGHLYALPADGFCSVLFYNADLIGENPPQTWAELREKAQELRKNSPLPNFYPIGHLPFVETLWSAGGYVCDQGRCGLDEPEARDALEFILALREERLLHPDTLGDPQLALELFVRGQTGMTVASSQFRPQTARAPFPVAMAAVPGKKGPIAALSEGSIVVFSRHAEAKREAIAAVLDFLTGPEVQGTRAHERGSAPVRTSVAADMRSHAGLEAAFLNGRATPLVPSWNLIEVELTRYLYRAYRWRPQPTRDSS